MPELRELAPDLWELEVHQHRAGLHFRNRMVVVRLPDGGLWLHSPVPLSDEVVDELRALGPVTHLVAPNLGHYQWLDAAASRFTEATVWAAPGFRARHPDVSVDHELHEVAPPWADVLAPRSLDGTPAVRETVFFHRASGTLVCTDVVIHVREEPSWATRCLYRMIGTWRVLAPASSWRWRTRDRAAARASYDAVLAWPIERVVMAHGDVVDVDARARLVAALSWAGPSRG